jgi:uncharacterized surface anchored protein
MVIETEAPQGFLLDETRHEITLGFDGEISEVITKQITLFNDRYKAKISLKKVVEFPENVPTGFNPYPSILFGLYAKDDILTADGDVAIPKDAVIEFITVNGNGDGLIQTDLPYGSYYIKELQTADGYILDDTVYDLVFTPDCQSSAVVSLAVNEGNVILNRLRHGSLKIIKTFEGKTVPVEGGPFLITGKTLAGIDFSLEVKTNAKGEIILDNLPVGTYTVRELTDDTNKGYILSPEKTIEVKYNVPVEMKIHNVLQSGSLKIVKVFEGKDTVKGVPFVITGTTAVGKDFYLEVFTDKNGEIFVKDMPAGEYVIKELAHETNMGYALADDKTVIIKPGETVEVTMYNKLIFGSIRIMKTDADTGEALSGALFGLYQDGKLIKDTKSDDDGWAVFEGLSFGTYEVKEIAAPAGYRLNDTVFTAEIGAEQREYEFKLTNEKEPDMPRPTEPGEIPKMGDTTRLVLWISLLTLSVTGIAVTLILKKRKPKKKDKTEST